MGSQLHISRAAQVIPCHPDTLRNLERKGLIRAKRDYRGFRVFNLKDLLRLKKEREKLQ
jgi:DNA-binding transcriptional MerR regulator